MFVLGVICEAVYNVLPENVVAQDSIGGEYYVGHKLDLDCEFYHQLFGSRMIECQRNGTWSGGDTYCIKSRCYNNAHVRVVRSSSPEMFYEKRIFESFAKLTRKHMPKSLFFNKVADIRPPTLLKKRLWQKRFAMNFPKLNRTHFLQNTSGAASRMFNNKVSGN